MPTTLVLAVGFGYRPSAWAIAAGASTPADAITAAAVGMRCLMRNIGISSSDDLDAHKTGIAVPLFHPPACAGPRRNRVTRARDALYPHSRGRAPRCGGGRRGAHLRRLAVPRAARQPTGAARRPRRHPARRRD